jgi:hypothetical protein
VIEASFDALRKELDSEIQSTMRETRHKLLENFDEEVHEKLRIHLTESREHLGRYEEWLWKLTRFALNGYADFADEGYSFRLNQTPKGVKAPLGLYRMGRKVQDAHIYRLNHPLAQWVIEQAKAGDAPSVELVFDYSGNGTTIMALAPLVGASGSLSLSQMTINSIESEDHLIISANTDDGEKLNDNQTRRLFNLPGSIFSSGAFSSGKLQDFYEQKKTKILSEIAERNSSFFDEEMNKLDKWADDKKTALDLTIKDTDTQIGILKAEIRKAAGLEQKVHLQRQIKDLEKKRTDMRRRLFDTQDEIDGQKESLLDSIEARMQQQIVEEELFTIRWRLK